MCDIGTIKDDIKTTSRFLLKLAVIVAALCALTYDGSHPELPRVFIGCGIVIAIIPAVGLYESLIDLWRYKREKRIL